MFHSSSSEWKVIFYLELLTLLFLEFCSHFKVFINFSSYLLFLTKFAQFYSCKPIVLLPSAICSWLDNSNHRGAKGGRVILVIYSLDNRIALVVFC